LGGTSGLVCAFLWLRYKVTTFFWYMQVFVDFFSKKVCFFIHHCSSCLSTPDSPLTLNPLNRWTVFNL
jgi:hypothetical protein